MSQKSGRNGIASKLVTASGKLKASAAPSYTLPKASSDTLGGVKIGTGISIDSGGKISVNSQSKTLTLGSAAPETVNPDSGKVLSSVPVSIDSSVIKAENIAQGATILGVAGSHSGGSTVHTTTGTSDDGYTLQTNITTSPTHFVIFIQTIGPIEYDKIAWINDSGDAGIFVYDEDIYGVEETSVGITFDSSTHTFNLESQIGYLFSTSEGEYATYTIIYW